MRVDIYRTDLRCIFEERNVSEEVNRLNQESIVYITKSIELNPGPKVVITHFPPLPYMYSSKYDDSPNYFTNHLESLVNEKIKYWIYGHTHLSLKKIHRSCTIVSNQYGYPEEETGYLPEIVFPVQE
jgi:predicted phosphohydrolase